jgi:hypothetical protein
MWPPPVLPINRTNATPQLDTHAADHNAVNLAVNDLVGHVQSIDSVVARCGAGAAQSGYSIGAVAQVQMPWNTEGYDTDTMFTPGGTLFTIRQAGMWSITARILCSVSVTAACDISIQRVAGGVVIANYIPTGKQWASVSGTLPLVPGDQMYISVFNANGAAQFFSGSVDVVRVSI